MSCRFNKELRLKFLDSNTKIKHDALIKTQFYSSGVTYIIIYIFSNSEGQSALINSDDDNAVRRYNKSYTKYEYKVGSPIHEVNKKSESWSNILFKSSKQNPAPASIDYLAEFLQEIGKDFNKEDINKKVLSGKFSCEGGVIGGYSKKSKKKYIKRIYGIHKKSKHRKRLQTRKKQGQRNK